MVKLLTPLALRDVTLRHRIIVPPMAMYQARSDGKATDWHLAHYGRFAMGGAALVIIESTAVEPAGRIGYACLGLWEESQIVPLRRITDLMRQQNCVPGIQLNHTGRKGGWRRPWDGYQPMNDDDQRLRGERGWPVAGPSPVPVREDAPVPAEMDHDDIARNIALWAHSARLADRAGFDVLEIHGAHGYIVHQFLSPLSNRRGDRYGGDRAGRMRFALELAEAVRAAWPAGKPLFFRISSVDGIVGGWEMDDTVVLARELKARGVDVIDCSSGGIGGSATVTRLPRGPGFQVGFAERVRHEAGLPTVAVGLITDPDQAEAILAGGRADIIAIGRETLVDPNWPNAAIRHFRGGSYADWPAETGWWLEKRIESIRASRAS